MYMPSNRSTKKAIEKILSPKPVAKKSLINRSALLPFSGVHWEEMNRYPEMKQNPSARAMFIYLASSPAKSRTPLPKS